MMIRRIHVLALTAAMLALMAVPGPATAATGLRWGLNIWTVGSVPAADTAIGVKSSVIGIYRDFANAPNFPTSDATAIRNRGATPMIAWEPWNSYTGKETDPAFTSSQVASGRYDSLIRNWATQAHTFGTTVWIRFAPEQNGTWRPWSIGKTGSSASAYQAMWRHVVGIFRGVGATNVRWIWNPYVDVGGSSPMMAGYPGDSYVDMIGLDGFNWGSTRPWGWQSYDDIFASSVAILKAKAPTRPWLIAETASARGSKRPQWVSNTISRARGDGATAVVWFEFNKETDWRLSNDAASCTALRSALASG